MINNKYEIIDTINSGNYGKVYKVKYNNNFYALKEEINNDGVFEKWITGREAICQFYSGKQFEGGSIRPMMQNGCNLRLNSEAKRFCLAGDPQCG